MKILFTTGADHEKKEYTSKVVVGKKMSPFLMKILFATCADYEKM